MDLSFFRRMERSGASRAAGIPDYGVLVASLRAVQAAGASALLPAQDQEGPNRHRALVELLLGGPAWRDAIVAQQGCFNPRFRQMHVKAT